MGGRGAAEQHRQAGKDFNSVSGYWPGDGGSDCFVGGVGSPTCSSLSLARIVLSVLIAQAGQNGDFGLQAAENWGMSVEGREPR